MEAMAPRTIPLDVEHLLAQSGWARGLAQRLVRDPELAEDVLQETWVAALERPPSEGSVRAWLGVVVRNVSLRLRRREAARGEAERRVARREAVAGGQESVERMQLQRLLAEAILALQEPYRSAVILRHLDGLSAAEIAARQGCSDQVARQRVSRGLAQLRAELDRRTSGGRAAWCAALAGAWRLAGNQALPLAAAPAALWIGGAWMGAKLVAAAACVGLAVGAWIWVQRPSAPSSAPAARPSEVLAAMEAPDAPPAPQVAAAQPLPLPIPAAEAAREHVDAPAPFRTALRGRVLDEHGAGLIGAKVALSPWSPFPVETPAVVETESDSEGVFALELDRERSEELESNVLAFALSAELAGYVPAQIVVGSKRDLELVLVERPVVRGRLLDPHGEPAHPPGRVDFSVVDAAGKQHDCSAEIDDLGQFEARELVPGKLTSVRGRARGFGTGSIEPALDLAPGAREILDVELGQGAIVRGVVVDAESKAPIPFAEVWAQGWSYQAESIEPSAVADAEGQFELHGVELRQMDGGQLPATYFWLFISARAPGYAGKPFNGAVVHPDAERGFFVTIEVPRSDAAILGRIRWPDGSPASGLIVSGIDSQGNMLWKGTDDDGRFEVRGMPAGTFVVQAKTTTERPEDRMGVVRAEGELQIGQTLELELTLSEARGSISGRALDASGAPLAQVQLEASELIHAPNMTLGFGTHSTLTDADGHYRFSDLLEGTYQIELRGVPQGQVVRPEMCQVGLGAGQDLEGQDFEVLQGIVISGWVDPGNLGLSALEVQVVRVSDGAERGRCAPREDGGFTLAGLLPEPHEVVLLHRGNELARTSIGATGASNVRLVAPR
jgi:RNA polymerase sigma factor (sigma-70 family)